MDPLSRIHGRGGGLSWNTAGKPLMPVCLLLTVAIVENHKCQKLNKSDKNMRLDRCRDLIISGCE